MEPQAEARKHPWTFLITAVVMWIVFDLLVSYRLDFALFKTVWWFSAIFYVFYPLLYLYLYYYRLWDVSRAFVLMAVLMMVVEGFLIGSYQLYSFPELFLYIPLGLCAYALVIIVPLWIAERQLRYHWGAVLLCLIGAGLLALFPNITF